MADVNSASVRVKIVVETESAPSRHTVTKNPERIRSFQRVTNEASRIFSGKEKRNMNTCRAFLHYEDTTKCSIKFYRRRQIPTNLQSVITTLLLERKLSRDSVDANNRHELPATPWFHFETARLLQFCCNNAIVWTFASIFLAYTMEQYIYTVKWNSLSLRYITPFDIIRNYNYNYSYEKHRDTEAIYIYVCMYI